MSEYGPDEGVTGDGDGDDDGESILETLPAVFAVGTLGIGMLAAVLGAGELVPVVFVVGWFILTPLSAILGETKLVQEWLGGRHATASSHDDSVGDDEAALEELKRRYARGEIDEAEFERRTAMLLENDSIEDVAERVDRTAGVREDRDVPREAPRDAAGGDERQREREYET